MRIEGAQHEPLALPTCAANIRPPHSYHVSHPLFETRVEDALWDVIVEPFELMHQMAYEVSAGGAELWRRAMVAIFIRTEIDPKTHSARG